MLEKLSPSTNPNPKFPNLRKRTGNITLPHNSSEVLYTECATGPNFPKNTTKLGFMVEYDKFFTNPRKIYGVFEDKTITIENETQKIIKKVSNVYDAKDHNIIRQTIEKFYEKIGFLGSPSSNTKIWEIPYSMKITRGKGIPTISELNIPHCKIRLNPADRTDCYIKGFPTDISKLPIRVQQIIYKTIKFLAQGK